MHPYQPPADLLSERVILVTGAGDGLGRAAARVFAHHGARVVLLGRTVEKLEHVYDEIEQDRQGAAAITPLDLSTAGAKQYGELVAAIESEYGRLDGLLHSATELGQLTPLDMYDMELWQRVMQVNLQAPYLLTRHLLPLLANSGDASVVFTTADVGRQARAFWGAYAVSQFGLEGLSQIWAAEHEGGGKIRFNTLDPGPTKTAWRSRAYPAEAPGMAREAESLMAAYLYLIGPGSRGVTGKSLTAADYC